MLAVGIQIGKTKIFLRSRAFELIEHLRHESMDVAAINIQTVGRMRLDRRFFVSLRKSSIAVQCEFRRYISMKLVRKLRRNYMSTIIQCLFRTHLCRRCFLAILLVSRWSQATQRKVKAKELCLNLKRKRNAELIQRWWNMTHLHRSYKMYLKSCIMIQCSSRYHVSKRKLKELRLRQRDLAAVGEERDLLRKEVQKLRDELEKAQQSLRQTTEENNRNRNSTEVDALRKENAQVRSLLNAAETQLLVESERANGALKSAEKTTIDLAKSLEENEKIYKELKETKLSNSSKEEQLRALQQSMLVLRKQLEDEQCKNEYVASCSAKDQEKAREEYDKLDKDLKKSLSLNYHKDEMIRSLEHSSLDLMKRFEDLQNKNDQLTQRNEDLEKQLAVVSAKLMSAVDTEKVIDAEGERLKDELARARKELQEYQVKEEDINVLSDDKTNSLREEIHSLQDKLAEELKRNVEIMLTSEVKLNEAKDEVLTLRAKVKDLEDFNVNARSNVQNNSPTNPNPGLRAQGEAEFLQREVLRLEEELKEIREAMTSPIECLLAEQSTFNPNSSEHLLARYEELRKLSEANVMKDQEIENLRQENRRLQKQLDTQIHQQLPPELEIDEASSLGFYDVADGRDAEKEMDPFFFLKRNGVLTSPAGTNRTPNRDEEDALKVINEFLRAEVESLHKKLEAAENELKEEKQKSARDLAAFSEALHGVDKLRAAAEGMSRELARVKRRDKFNKMVSGKWDTMSLQDDNFSILSGGTSLIQEAQEKLAKSGKPHLFWGLKKK